jgi:DNA-binding CsgD family transcriptional regulator
MQAWQVETYAELGRWDEACDLCAQLLGHPDLTPVTVIPAASAVARIEARRGLDASVHLALASGLAPGTGELQRIAPAACAQAESAWLAGRTGELTAITEPAWHLVATRHDPWVQGELLWWRALAEPAPADDPSGDVAEPFALMAAGAWEQAAAAWSELGCPLWQAYALGLAPEVSTAQQGVGILEGLGATASIEAVLRTRRERGLLLPRRPRAAARERVGQLTTREFDILLLLADGLSTAELAGRLVVSPRTVEHHVSAILRKLGEPTRARAVAAARRLGVLEESA